MQRIGRSMKTKHYVATTKRIEAANYPERPSIETVIHDAIAGDLARLDPSEHTRYRVPFTLLDPHCVDVLPKLSAVPQDDALWQVSDRHMVVIPIVADVERTVHTLTKSVTLDELEAYRHGDRYAELADWVNTQLGTTHVDPDTVRLIGRDPIPEDESEFATQYSVCLDVDGNEPVAGIPPQWTFEEARAAALDALRADPSLPGVRIRAELVRDNGSPVLDFIPSPSEQQELEFEVATLTPADGAAVIAWNVTFASFVY